MHENLEGLKRQTSFSSSNFFVALLIIIVLVNCVLRIHAREYVRPDDTIATKVARESDTLEEFNSELNWGLSLAASVYYQYKYLGLETDGRRFFALPVVFICLFLLLRLLYRKKFFTWSELLLLCLCLSFSLAFLKYGTFSLITYTIGLVYSIISVMVLLTLYRNPPKLGLSLILGFLFGVIVLLFSRAFAGVCALACTLIIGHLYRCPKDYKFILKSTVSISFLLLPSLVVIYIFLKYYPHVDFQQVRPDLEPYYFGFSYKDSFLGAPKTILGAVDFAATRTVNLLRQAFLIDYLAYDKQFVRYVWSDISALLFLIGFVTSFYKCNSKRFPIAVYLFIGICGHIGLGLFDLCPYGRVRYFLPFYICLPLFAVLGVRDLCNFIISLMSTVISLIISCFSNSTDSKQVNKENLLNNNENSAKEKGNLAIVNYTLMLIAIASSVAIIYVEVPYAKTLIQRAKNERYYRETAFNNFLQHENVETMGLAVSPDAFHAAGDKHPAVLARDYIMIWPTTQPLSDARVNEWVNYIDKYENMYIITGSAFTKENYGPFFQEVTKKYDIETSNVGKKYYIAELKILDLSH